MSAKPIPFPINEKQEQVERRKKAEGRSDTLYIAGAILVAAGVGMIRFYLAPIALGFFCLLLPALELATGFVRGLRAPQPGRR
jgi:hypothetical protein